MQAVSHAIRSILSLPAELLDAVLQGVRPRDVDSFGRTCRKFFGFVNAPQFLDGYLRQHPRRILQRPESPPTLPWLRQPSAVNLTRMRASSNGLPADEVRQRNFAALLASDLLGGEPVKLQVLASGEFTTADLGSTISSSGWRGRRFYAAARRDQNGAAHAVVFTLPQELGYAAMATGAFSFPSEGIAPIERRLFSLYEVEGNLVGLCTAGAQTRVYLVVPARHALHHLHDNTLTPHPLTTIPLTSHEMAPIMWSQKAHAVMMWSEGVPELWAVASPV